MWVWLSPCDSHKRSFRDRSQPANRLRDRGQRAKGEEAAESQRKGGDGKQGWSGALKRLGGGEGDRNPEVQCGNAWRLNKRI